MLVDACCMFTCLLHIIFALLSNNCNKTFPLQFSNTTSAIVFTGFGCTETFAIAIFFNGCCFTTLLPLLMRYLSGSMATVATVKLGSSTTNSWLLRRQANITVVSFVFELLPSLTGNGTLKNFTDVDFEVFWLTVKYSLPFDESFQFTVNVGYPSPKNH